MPTGYCQLVPDITDIVQSIISFSSEIYALSPEGDNTGNIDLSINGITMDNAYSGYKIRFEFCFENAGDLTEYNLYKQSGQEGSTSMILIYTGNTGVDETIPNVMVVAAAGWSGAAAIDDVVVMTTASHMSVDQGERIVNDIEAEIDQALRERAIVTTDEGTIPTDLYFVLTAPPVPRQIKIATAHFASFRMVDYLFKASRSIMPVSAKEDGKDINVDFVMAYQWVKIAKKALADWIRVYETRNAGNAPRWTAIQPSIMRSGVEGQLHGVLEQEDDGDYTLPDDDVLPFTSIEELLNS